MVVGNSDIKANSVQLLLQLPTGTELGKRKVTISFLNMVFEGMRVHVTGHSM